MRHGIFVSSLVVAAFIGRAFADAPRIANAESHENGEARWKSGVISQTSDVCMLEGLNRAIELGKLAERNPRVGEHDCVASSAWIQNTSQRSIYCHATLKLDKPDDSGRKEISGQDFIPPNATRSLATAYGEEKRAPSKAITTCEVKSDVLLPSPPVCNLKVISFPDPNLFYPEESRRREEEGDVIMDFRIDVSAQKLRDFRVTESSGHRSLDFAAMRLGRKIMATSNCPGMRRQIKVNFRLAGEAVSWVALPASD